MAFRHLVAMKCLGDERECIIAFSLLSCLSWCVLKYYMSWGHVLPLCVCVCVRVRGCVCVCHLLFQRNSICTAAGGQWSFQQSLPDKDTADRM